MFSEHRGPGPYRHSERAALESAILERPDWADARLADYLRVHRATVRRGRDRLEARGDLAPRDTVICRDGAVYPARLRRGRPV